MGHPDKVADQISDAILDHCLAADDRSRVACETMVTTRPGNRPPARSRPRQTWSARTVDKIIRNMVREIGYTDPSIGFAAKTVQVHINLHAQSPDISMGVGCRRRRRSRHDVRLSRARKRDTDAVARSISRIA